MEKWLWGLAPGLQLQVFVLCNLALIPLTVALFLSTRYSS